MFRCSSSSSYTLQKLTLCDPDRLRFWLGVSSIAAGRVIEQEWRWNPPPHHHHQFAGSNLEWVRDIPIHHDSNLGYDIDYELWNSLVNSENMIKVSDDGFEYHFKIILKSLKVVEVGSFNDPS